MGTAMIQTSLWDFCEKTNPRKNKEEMGRNCGFRYEREGSNILKKL